MRDEEDDSAIVKKPRGEKKIIGRMLLHTRSSNTALKAPISPKT